MLSKLAEHQLYANGKKCEFGQRVVSYLGHVISEKGVEVDMEKVQAIMDCPVPANLRALRGFLGLTGYYRKFVKHYAQIAQPLTEQLRKDKFGWTEEATAAFNRLKSAMTQPPVLAMPDWQKSFVVETDASGFGIGAILMQDQRPLAFFSKLLGPQAQQKCVYEKELMAVCLAVQKWRSYLLGRHFVIRTDQQSIKFITQQREIGLEYQKWVRKLMGYDFEVQFKPGVANRVADALSRKQAGEVLLGALVCRPVLDWSKLRQEIAADSWLQLVKTELTQGSTTHKGYNSG